MPDVFVFDLDGTILSANSFRLWADYMLRAPFPHLAKGARRRAALVAAGNLLARKMGVISHETLKWRLQNLWRFATRGDQETSEQEFITLLRQFVRPSLTGVLAAVAGDEIDAILATAAVEDYAVGFGRSLGFTHILATERNRAAGDPSNVGVHKRDAVLEYIARHGWRDRALTLFTDHLDDLPLIRRSRTVYWFGPERERVMLERNLPQTSLRPGGSGTEVFPERSTS